MGPEKQEERLDTCYGRNKVVLYMQGTLVAILRTKLGDMITCFFVLKESER